MTSTEACKATYTGLCDRMYACFTSDQLGDFEKAAGFTDATGCAKSASDAICPEMKALVDKKTVAFSPNQVPACRAALTSVACGDDLGEFMSNSKKIPACKGVFQGTVAKLGSCTNSKECAAANAQCVASGNCTAALTGESYEKECSSKTINDCDGLTCLTLKDNKQNMTGICSAYCDDADDCGAGAACVDFEFEFEDNSQLCLSLCQTNADCSGGFMCVELFKDGTKACFVSLE